MTTTEQHLRQQLEHEPDDFDILLQLGQLLESLHRTGEAMHYFQRCVELRPTALGPLFSLGTIQHSLKRFDAALASFGRIIDVARSGQVPVSSENLGATYNNLGNVYRDMDRDANAEACYRLAIQHNPELAQALNSLGQSLFNRSQIDAAKEAFRAAIALDGDYIEAHYHLALCETRSRRDDEVLALERLWERDDWSIERKSMLAFSMGRVADQLGEPANAFRYWQEGNRLQRELQHYDCAARLRRERSIERSFGAEVLHGATDEADDGLTPIFVVGMPRSGSSLVEQILASHSMVYGAGELPFIPDLIATHISGFPDDISAVTTDEWRELGQRYLARLRDLSADHAYVVDKMLVNYQYIGAIRLMLPNAKIVHSMRNPLATCLSCFQQGFRDDRLGFTTSLEDLGQAYLSYRHLLAHWDAMLPGWVYPLSYEQSVFDLEKTVRNLLDFCGLPFEQACLDFHVKRRVVKTASAEQVRRPIYRDSIDRWKKYRHELDELATLLRQESSGSPSGP
jgi:tetratricopeptide (TPR) repeat protein